MDPLKIEQLFEQVQNDLKVAGSERAQLLYIYRFLKAISGHFQAYDSYLIQLFQEFPLLDHPLLFTGFHPQKLDAIIKKCEEAIEVIPELQTKDIRNGIDLLHSGLKHVNQWVGKTTKGEDKRLISSSAYMEEGKGKEKKEKGEVFIPVVEQAGENQLGRLRKIQVELVGHSKNDECKIRPVFGVIGANVGTLGDSPAKAAETLLREHVQNTNFWEATAYFELSHTWHAGRSGNLALAGLFYCEMLKAENKREYFGLNPSIAITGDIDEDGQVLAVDRDTLQKKVEAAFFSWIQVLIVPVHQLDVVSPLIEKLETEFPHRNLAVKGVQHLRELFYDRRISMHHSTSLLRHSIQKFWERKNGIAVITTIFGLLSVIGLMMYGPIDKNPVAVTFTGENMVLQNSAGREVVSINVGEYTVEQIQNSRMPKNRFYNFIDTNGDGTNEILWRTFRYDGKGRNILYLGNNYGDTLWTFSMKRKLEYEHHPYINKNDFTIDIIDSYDSDEDGQKEIFITTLHDEFFPSFLLELDPKTGRIKQEYLHQGHIEDLGFIALEELGTHNAVIIGGNNEFKKAFLAVLDLKKLNGQGASTSKYASKNYSFASEILYVLFPKTLPDSTSQGRPAFETYGKRIEVNQSSNMFSGMVQETYRFGDGGYGPNANVVYSFDDKLNIVSIGSSNVYDQFAAKLYQQGIVDVLADGKYLESFKDSLLYWNGERFLK